MAAAVLVVAFVTYVTTVAPTTSFWDCGEFIAASYTMGVPHPPGAPLYLLVGRLFSLLPIASDIGLRVNLISTLVSTVTVLLLYLCIVRLARAWRGAEKSVSDKIAVYGSAAIGALCFAFSYSFWWNAVEAEVYSVSMFLTAMVFYLALRWLDVADEPAGNRILLFIFYLIGLSAGVHILNILALISVALIVAFRKRGVSLRNFILAGLIGSAIIFAIYPGIIQGLPELIKSFSVWIAIALLIVIIWLTVSLVRSDRRTPAFALLAALLVILGYSTFLIIKIRSGLNPFLDENDPETWSRFLSYLKREQYGTENLFLTMFQRKAPLWTYQINKMYLRYLGWQYLDFPRLFAIPFLLGIIGVFHQFYRDAKGGLVVLALFLMTGLAVILYLNQDDPQPRERDYAYVGSFFAFAIWIGLGVLALVETVASRLKRKDAVAPVAALAALCVAVAPLNMVLKNYRSHSRAGNYVAWDYSYNLLNTCAPDAILYTNGDNDTFPVWYLQEVAGIRKDVRVVNLSLLNTGWFIKQIRDKEPQVPMTARLSDDYIDNVIESRDVSGLMERRWAESRKVRIDGPDPNGPDMIWEAPGTMSYPIGPGGRQEYFLRVQDVMILNTIVASRWQRPTYFAVTVSDGSLLGLRNIKNPSENYVTMEGLAFRLHPEPSPFIDPEAMAENMLHRYRYRNTNNPKVYFNDNIVKLLGNYRQGLIQLAYHHMDEYEKSGAAATAEEDSLYERLTLDDRVERFAELSPRLKALTALDYMDYILPEELVPISYDIISLQIGKLYSQLGRPERMKGQLDRLTNRGGLNASTAYEYGVYYLTEAAAREDAARLFEQSLKLNKSFENYQRIAYTWLQYAGDTARAADVFRRYLTIDDSRQTKLRVASQSQALGLAGLAFSIYEPLLQANPDDREALSGMVDLYRSTGDDERALALVEQWLREHPGDNAMTKVRDQILARGFKGGL